MADSLPFYRHQSGIRLLEGRASDPSSEDDKETRRLAYALHSQQRYCGRLAGWHPRDPVAPCGNQRQTAMKDGGRLFPVIEALLMVCVCVFCLCVCVYV